MNTKPRTRQSRSQTVLLAKNYGGDKFNHTVRHINKSNDFALDTLDTIQTLESTKVKDNITEENLPLVEVHNNDIAA